MALRRDCVVDLITPALIRSLQRKSGSAAVMGWLRGTSRPVQRIPTVQRADAPLKGVSLTVKQVTVPLEPGVIVKATARPGTVSGVKFSLEAGAVSPASGTTIDAATGAITIDPTQPGGTMKVKATGATNWVDTPFEVIEMPLAITSSAASPKGGKLYGGTFVHTFSAASGNPGGLRNANLNEAFDSPTTATPFGGAFSLTANRVGSVGWFLDSSGRMTTPDNVTIGTAGIDIGDFVRSESNPSPKKALPTGFTMTQHLQVKSLPSGTLRQFMDTSHSRTLMTDATFEVAAGSGKLSQPYIGPPAFSNARATPSTVSASAPRPKGGAGWQQNTVQITCDALPANAAKSHKIRGDPLGCTVGASGIVMIGGAPGTITVRISGRGKHYDEVKITIEPYKAPAPPGGKKAELDPSERQSTGDPPSAEA